MIFKVCPKNTFTWVANSMDIYSGRILRPGFIPDVFKFDIFFEFLVSERYPLAVNDQIATITADENTIINMPIAVAKELFTITSKTL